MNGPKGPGIPCPDCGGPSRVRNSRPAPTGTSLRRRRICKRCDLAFATVEQTITGDPLDSHRQQMVDEIAKRYLALGIAGRATVRKLITALEEAEQRGAKHEAAAMAAEAAAQPMDSITQETAR